MGSEEDYILKDLKKLEFWAAMFGISAISVAIDLFCSDMHSVLQDIVLCSNVVNDIDNVF